MERLTPGVQTAYPVERTIMETGSERSSVKPTVKKPLEERMADIVKKFTEKQQEKSQNLGKKENKDEGLSGSGGNSGGRFDKFDPDKFKGQPSLEELAKDVQVAARQGKIDEDFLRDIKRQLDIKTHLGRISNNWNQNFTSYLNSFIVSENLSEIKGEDKELSQDIEAIVAQRKLNGLTAEQVQASRAAMEAAFGRKLTEAELQRATLGSEGVRGTTSEAFELQMRSIESLIDNPKKYEAFLKTISTQNPEVIKKALSGTEGKLVLGVLLGDIVERDKFYNRLDEILKKDPQGIQDSLSGLVDEIKRQEGLERVKEDPALAKKIREDFEKEVKGIKSRFLSDEAMESIRGGSDDELEYEKLQNILENLPEENNQIFKSAKAEFVDYDFIDLKLGEIYGNDSNAITSRRQAFNDLKNIDDPAEFRIRAKALLDGLKEQAKKTGESPSEAKVMEEGRKMADEMSKKGEIRKGAKSFRDLEWVGYDFFREKPRNVIDVATWIVSSDDYKTWGPGGIYPLFEFDPNETIKVERRDPDTGRIVFKEVQKPIFQEKNFIRWVRQKALEHHGDNPNDPISLLQSINIETLFSPVSILTMKYNKQQYFSDHDGNLLSNLANEVIHESWLFGVRRNKNLGYIQVMNSDEKLFEAIVEMSGKNDHTGGTNLVDYLKMGEDFNDKDGNRDNKVGDAMLAANHIYRNLADIDKLRQMLPPDSSIFTVEGFKKASRILNKEDFDADTKGWGNLRIEGNRVYFKDPKTKINSEIFDSSGNLVLSKAKDLKDRKPENLVKFLNFFPAANPDETNEAFVRELTRQSIAELVGFDAGADREKFEEFKKEHGEMPLEEYRKLQRMNLEWAEINSWVEQRWNGAAARNDTGYRGYDAWTKMYAQYYRERQSGSRTAGPVGNPHDMQIFRMLTPDMWLAIRTESGESVHEIFEELHMANLRLYKLKGELTPEQEAEKKTLEEKKKAAYNKLRFPRWTESDWAGNGVKRQSEVWHNIMNTEDLKFNELAKRDTWGVLRYDRQKFEEVVKDDFIKKRRYAFASNNAMNYGAMTRMRVRTAVEFNKDGTVVEGSEKYAYVDKPLAEAMFGDIVVKSIKDEWYDGKLEFEGADANGKKVMKVAPKKGEKFDPDKHGTYQEFLNSAKAREKILKNVCRAGIAAQINSHRERAGTTERWDAEVVRKLLQSLRTMPQYIEDPLTGEERRVDGSQFFSEEDIRWIRKQTNTGKGMLLFEDSYHAGWDILAGGLPDILKLFYQDIIT